MDEEWVIAISFRTLNAGSYSNVGGICNFQRSKRLPTFWVGAAILLSDSTRFIIVLHGKPELVAASIAFVYIECIISSPGSR